MNSSPVIVSFLYRSQLVELKLVLLQNLQSAVVRILDQLGDNRVHTLGRTGGAGERRVLIEIRVLHGTERHHAKLVGHTKARHHITGELGGLLDIVGGAGRHLAKDELHRSRRRAYPGPPGAWSGSARPPRPAWCSPGHRSCAERW